MVNYSFKFDGINNDNFLLGVRFLEVLQIFYQIFYYSDIVVYIFLDILVVIVEKNELILCLKY